jgi:hypothetical protein
MFSANSIQDWFTANDYDHLIISGFIKVIELIL